MTTKHMYVCTRDNENPKPGEPSVFACTLTLTDTGTFWSSGTWETSGVDPDRLFSSRGGEWTAAANVVTLEGIVGRARTNIQMKDFNEEEGWLQGDGLVGGYHVRWKKT